MRDKTTKGTLKNQLHVIVQMFIYSLFLFSFFAMRGIESIQFRASNVLQADKMCAGKRSAQFF